jgi:lysozyme
MTPSQNCIDLIKEFEGCRLNAYYDPGTGNLPITIGYGSTYKRDGTRFKITDTIDHFMAEELLKWEVDNKATIIAKLLPQLNQNQFDALIDFAYNVGVGNLQNSTLLKIVKIDRNNPAIRDEFLKWNKSSGRVLSGLTRRRLAEWELYNRK